MAVFIWQATDRNGLSQKGEMLADNQNVVISKLRKQGYKEFVIRQKGREGFSLFPVRVTEQDVVIYLRQLSVLVGAGIPLMTCFTQMAKGSNKAILAEMSLRIRDSIGLGVSLSHAMEKEPALFDAFTINLVRVAEKSGVLNVVLDRLATYKEKSFNLRNKVRSALTYPVVVLIIALAIFYMLMVKVVPVFVDLYKSFDAELPMATQTVISLSEFTQAWWWVVLAAVLVGVKAGSVAYKRSPKVRYDLDDALLKFPVLGEILKKAAIARFARSFSTMLAAGTPILECLEPVARTAGNRVLEVAVENAKSSIMEGRLLTEPWEENQVFPPLVTQMIYVGETTGNLDFMLNKVADFYDQEVDRAVDNIKALMEPFIMVLLGAMIGGIV
ncbi:MAG: type II secretion system F family protein, partial [Magnetococcales bacterium]|nr:type II secretion system F family protein [Magnetococcales bacterium]